MLQPSLVWRTPSPEYQAADQAALANVGFNPEMPYLPEMPEVPTFVGFEIPK